MPEPRLHHLERQLEAAIDAPVDAPGGVEVAQAMQAVVFRFAVSGNDAGRDLRRLKSLIDDDKPGLHTSAGTGEHEIKLASWADELPLAQCMDDHRRQRHRALAGFRF